MRKIHDESVNEMKEKNVFAEFVKKALAQDEEPKVEATKSEDDEEVQ